MEWGLVLGAVIVVVLVVASMSIMVVQQQERAVVFRLGRTDETMVREPGLRFLVPVIDRPVKVSMIEQAVALHTPRLLTADHVLLRIDGDVYWRVVDPLKRVLNVSDFGAALAEVASKQMGELVGDMRLSELLSSRTKLVTDLTDRLTPMLERWGGVVTTVDIREITPEPEERQFPAELRGGIPAEAEGAAQ